MLKGRGCLVAIVLALLIVILLFAGVDFYTDLVWFDSFGLASVMWKRIGTQWLLFAGAWLGAGLFLFANWWLARRLTGGGPIHVPWLRPQPGSYRGTVVMQPDVRTLGARAVTWLLGLAAVGLGFLFATPARAVWLTALTSIAAVPFGTTDPILGRDLSFYMLRLPWLRALQGWLLWLVLLALAGAALIYLVTVSVGQVAVPGYTVPGQAGTGRNARRRWLRLPPGAERHLTVLGAAVLGLLAWGYQLSIPRLLYSTAGAAYGAGYTDVHARLPVLQILTWIVAAGAVVLLLNLVIRVRWLPVAVVGAWLLVALVGGGLYPGLLQKLSVDPNELAREQPYIEHSIAFTRAGFGLDRIASADYPLAEEVPALDVEANQSTIENIRLWDYRPLLSTYGQLQTIRPYYTFLDVDVDRYRVGDRDRQVMLTVREMNHAQLAETAQTWLNRHLIYTHGLGVALNPVNEVGQEGLPELWVQDIPPRSSYPELALTQPQVYFGELTDDYVIVDTSAQEFDYTSSSGDENVYITYEGGGGVRLGSPITRLAYALRLGSSQILLSGYINSESRLLWRRLIDERVETLAPFLRYDHDPYPVIIDGRLVWLLDAYTVSDRYPYSEPVNTRVGWLNYIRNSVKVAIDAYDGSVSFYLIDPQDPLAATYARIFPDLFRPVSEMDPDLVAHWRYPEDVFSIQATRYQRYHMTDPQVFYNQEDLWAWPVETVEGQQAPIEPYYVTMSLPDQAAPEFVLMLPFTPANKQNMASWLYARNDGSNYGQLGLFQFPKQFLIYGPAQVESRINQDPTISAQLTLWDSSGSQVIRGNLLVFPLEQAILYVQPVFLQAETSRFPELQRVIVVYGNRIAMRPTLADALADVAGTTTGAEQSPPVESATPAATGDVAALAEQANQHYLAAQDCLQTQDWPCYGREMDALEQVLRELLAATETQP